MKTLLILIPLIAITGCSSFDSCVRHYNKVAEQMYFNFETDSHVTLTTVQNEMIAKYCRVN